MKQKINLRLIGIAVIAVLATAIGITFIYYGLFKKQVQAGLRTMLKYSWKPEFLKSRRNMLM